MATLSRNTRELWESTLTEEQQEQLAAGTLAIPANVSVPGDGSFARQWWYDQQSAEDQVLIDSGELEYPSHLAADTFTDTFALGENTNIDLIANTGTINLKGLSFNKGSSYPYEINYRGIYFSTNHSCPLFLGSCHTKTDTEVTVLRVVPYAYWPNDDENKNLTESTGLYIASPIVNTGSNADSTIDEIKSLKIVTIEEERISNNGTSYCIFTRQDNVSAAGSANGKRTFNIYATANAPNFFKGNTHIGGDTSRNTFELWKSTLTEEQREQLEAGTLAVPYNVSTPGDGSFARQWWYDQQSAEDQALLDSGELEYPTHLAAATFTDTFALGDNTKIKLGSDGTADFTGVTTHAGGVSVTGATVPSDASDSRYPLLNGFPGGRLEILPRGTETSDQVRLVLNTPDANGAGGGAQIIHNKSLGGAQENVLRISGIWTGDYTVSGGNTYTTNAYLSVAGDIGNTTTSFSKPIIGVSSGANLDTDNHWVSFSASGVVAADANKAASYIGYLSRVGSDSGDTAFGFYGDGDAPNFFKGNTYIGGAATRNTRELWESTLTEEQKEQLSAGTLAIPANVSTPGDGSFVRQWWYNQQSAENQALIDSGELDYPKNFQAANFTDNFALGENTKINLLSDGVGEFSGGVRVTGSGTIDNGMTANNGVLRITQNSQQAIIIRDTRINASGRVFNFAANSDAIEIDGKQVINGIQCTLTKPPTKDADDNDLYLATGNSACQFQAGFDDVKFAGSFGFVKAAVTTASNTSVDHFWGYNADNSLGLFNAEDPDSTQKVTGYYTNLQQRTNKNIYAFYSARNAPSYFNGAVTGGGTDAASAVWSIDSTGTATGIDVTAASVVTDADNGTVETLLDIITDLRSRIKDLEEG